MLEYVLEYINFAKEYSVPTVSKLELLLYCVNPTGEGHVLLLLWIIHMYQGLVLSKLGLNKVTYISWYTARIILWY